MRKEIPEHRRNTVDSLAVEQKAKKDAQKAKRASGDLNKYSKAIVMKASDNITKS